MVMINSRMVCPSEFSLFKDAMNLLYPLIICSFSFQQSAGLVNIPLMVASILVWTVQWEHTKTITNALSATHAQQVRLHWAKEVPQLMTAIVSDTSQEGIICSISFRKASTPNWDIEWHFVIYFILIILALFSLSLILGDKRFKNCYKPIVENFRSPVPLYNWGFLWISSSTIPWLNHDENNYKFPTVDFEDWTLSC